MKVHFLERDRFKHLVHLLGEHKFWDTQPIMKLREKVKGGKQGIINDSWIKAEDTPKEPTPLPEGYYWDEFDVMADKVCEEVCE